jgi:Ser/Thr protein kinase RdoA (MazF antagonist)
MRFGIPDVTPATARDVTAFRAQSSVLDEQALLHHVIPAYEIPSVTSCRFLTRGDADIYRLEGAGGRHYLKVRRPPVTAAQCEAEAAFVHFLFGNGAPVVRPVRLRHSPAHGVGFVTEVNAPEGPRPILVFEEAPPGRPGSPSVEQSSELGKLLANLHNAADAWPGAGLGDADFANLNNSLQDIIVATNPPAGMSALLYRAVELVQTAYARIPRTLPHFGPIHGDLASSNIRIDVDGRFWLFDFGAARRSWRHNELLNAKARLLNDARAPSPEEKWIAFQEGYKSRRPLPPDLSALEPAYHLSVRIGTLGYICNALTLRLGVEVVDHHDFAKAMTEISALAEQCISGVAP